MNKLEKSSPLSTLKAMRDGLSMMILFTTMWIIIAEVSLSGRDHWIIGLLFLLVVIIFSYYYWQLHSYIRSMPDQNVIEESPEEKKRGKWFGIIFGLEGAAIFIANLVLSNTGLSYLFICSFALIVGLHFFPLAKVFNRKWDYYIGSWTVLVALSGLILILNNTCDQALINGMVCVGCALATSANAIRMIQSGLSLIRAK